MKAMVRVILGLAATAAWAFPSMAAGPVSFDMSAEADKDVVYEAGKGKAAAFGEKAEANQAFVEDGRSDGAQKARGLPKGRKLPSTEPLLGDYQLLPYEKNNVIELATRSDAPAENHLIKVPAKKYKAIGLLVAAVQGDTSFTIKLKYKDGAEEVLWWEADDWNDEGDALRASQHPVISKMDRVRTPEGSVDKAEHYSLFEFFVKPDATKVLESITIGNDPNRWPNDMERWAVVFAVNGAAVD